MIPPGLAEKVIRRVLEIRDRGTDRAEALYLEARTLAKTLELDPGALLWHLATYEMPEAKKPKFTPQVERAGRTRARDKVYTPPAQGALFGEPRWQARSSISAPGSSTAWARLAASTAPRPTASAARATRRASRRRRAPRRRS
jgi:hypothetical protein